MRVKAGTDEFTFDPNRFLNVELIAIERATGMNAAEFEAGLNRGSFIAATALIWVLKKRHGDVVPFDSIEFVASSFELAPEDDVEVKASTPETSSGTTHEPVPLVTNTTNTTPDFLTVGD